MKMALCYYSESVEQISIDLLNLVVNLVVIVFCYLHF
jgi:hypothetical protein